MPQCPQCGYCLGPNNTETGHPQSRTTNEMAGLIRSEGELSILHAELLSLENLIEKLNQNRLALASKINRIQATTRHLPAEVLSSIFAFASPPIDFTTRYADLDPSANLYRVGENAPFVLASVCHLWRQVVLSTSQLWMTVALRVDRESSITSIISLLNLYFERARGIPISIELEFNDEVYEKDQQWEVYLGYLSLIEPLKTALLVEGENKIQLLGFVRAPIEWLLLLNEIFTQCTTVMVFRPVEGYPGAHEDCPLDLTRMPCLRRVEWVSRFNLPEIPDTVTTLRLRSVGFEDCYHSLMSYSNLVDFEMTDFLGFRPSIPNVQINGPIVFPQLEHFRCYPYCLNIYIPPFLDFLRHARFPKLRSLHWYYTPEASYDHHDPHFNFFSNLPSTLSSLTIFRLRHFDDNGIFPFVRELLNCVPQVSKLHLDQCGKLEIEILIDAIGRPLSLPPALNPNQQYAHQQLDVDGDIGSLQGNKVLPHLRELVIDRVPEGEWGLDRIDPQKIGHMLEALRVAGGNREAFRLVLGSSLNWCYDRESLLHLRTVARASGFDLETHIDSWPYPWDYEVRQMF